MIGYWFSISPSTSPSHDLHCLEFDKRQLAKKDDYSVVFPFSKIINHSYSYEKIFYSFLFGWPQVSSFKYSIADQNLIFVARGNIYHHVEIDSWIRVKKSFHNDMPHTNVDLRFFFPVQSNNKLGIYFPPPSAKKTTFASLMPNEHLKECIRNSLLYRFAWNIRERNSLTNRHESVQFSFIFKQLSLVWHKAMNFLCNFPSITVYHEYIFVSTVLISKDFI